jgi:hypothetical protein
MDETPVARNDERITSGSNNPNAMDRQSSSRETSIIHSFPPPHTRHTSQVPLHQTQSQENAIVCLWGSWKLELGGYHDHEPTETWDKGMEKDDRRGYQSAASGKP